MYLLFFLNFFFNFIKKMQVTFKQKLTYFFDNTLTKGTKSVVMWLSVVTLILVLFFSLIYLAIGIKFEGTEQLNYFEAFWQTLMRSLDPGNVASDQIWIMRIVGLLVTISGIFILSSLIGILSSGLDTRLEELKRGRSIVLTKNHTLIIGWSSKIFHIIEQLVIANENQNKPSIVILSAKDKVEMENVLRDKISDFKNTKIICRTGNAYEYADLQIVNPDDAKSIIILAPEDIDRDLHDIHIIKTLMALIYNDKRANNKYHIITEIKDKDNLGVAQIAGGDEVSLIYPNEVVSKITAQTCHQSGLSIIYMELLAYEGDEIYFQHQAELAGKTFKEILFDYETSSVIGIKRKDGKILINPPMNTVFEDGDQVIAISEDDDTVILSGKKNILIDKESIVSKQRVSSIKKENNLILGWNSKSEKMIIEMDNYLAKDSFTTIVINPNYVNYDFNNLIVSNQKIEIKKGDYSKRKYLLDLETEKYDNIIILANDNVSPEIADSITLFTLIQLRQISKEKQKEFNIISEMFIEKNRKLAEITKANDFIISHDLISRILAQVSENKDIKYILDYLFDSEGSEIYLKEADNYVKLDTPVNFYTVVESASRIGEVAIGYRIIADSYNKDKNYGIVTNPNKAEKITFSKGDKIIVLAED